MQGAVRHGLLQAFLRPRALVLTTCALAAIAGWITLVAMAGEFSRRTAGLDAGPGMGLAGALLQVLVPGDGLLAVLTSLCRAAIPQSLSADPASLPFAVSFLAVLVMWLAMTAAMMLPGAAPMFSTYANIAEAARERSVPVAGPLVLVAGYATVWIGFGLLASGAQVALVHGGWLSGALRPVSPYLAAGILAVAGAYQFSAYKHACLARCRAPFAFFFANWTVRPAGIFKLGLRQGVVCLACCWALMSVMFAAGLMNIVWMALLGILMALEKTVRNPRPLVAASGAGFLVWAAAFAVMG